MAWRGHGLHPGGMSTRFANPLLAAGPDPFATFHDGWYYVLVTEQDRIGLRRTRDLGRLASAEHRVLYLPGSDPGCMTCLWAPELHRVHGTWTVLFTGNTADDDDRNRRLFTLTCTGDDPWAGRWTMNGRLRLPVDTYSIDATVIDDGTRQYCAFSTKRGLRGGWWQHIAIAEFASPTALGDSETIISRPDQAWECDMQPTNEGPQVLWHGDDLWLAYSASAFWSPEYCLGFLRARRGADLLDPRSWTKLGRPFFRQDPAAGVYGPGHNSFIHAPDGSDWLMYHARSVPQDHGGDTRSTRLQPFGWTAAGEPDLGTPVAAGAALDWPADGRSAVGGRRSLAGPTPER